MRHSHVDCSGVVVEEDLHQAQCEGFRNERERCSSHASGKHVFPLSHGAVITRVTTDCGRAFVTAVFILSQRFFLRQTTTLYEIWRGRMNRVADHRHVSLTPLLNWKTIKGACFQDRCWRC